ncbi:unnamed protein product [Paramecium sonneborni]|uniref:C2H2-type domain-containing protein n=1 Tax=Paramecium sonneborni TaxID=65129 RepID=A0A8S1N3I5_9CILI|nr:unnamed protein product [Paramecium sonneborni]
MNSPHFIRQIESEDTNSLQASNQTFNLREDQENTIQADFLQESVSGYLNLSDSPYEQEFSSFILEDPPKVKTKKDNFIIIKNNLEYQCGFCEKVFSYSHSLGGHVQKNHRIQKNYKARLSSIRLRTRPVRNCQH